VTISRIFAAGCPSGSARPSTERAVRSDRAGATGQQVSSPRPTYGPFRRRRDHQGLAASPGPVPLPEATNRGTMTPIVSRRRSWTGSLVRRPAVDCRGRCRRRHPEPAALITQLVDQGIGEQLRWVADYALTRPNSGRVTGFEPAASSSRTPRSSRMKPCLCWPTRIWMEPSVLVLAVVAVLRCCVRHSHPYPWPATG
jgi:hypothetical protein